MKVACYGYNHKCLWSIGHGQGHGQHVANSAQCTFLTVTIYMQICCTSKRRELVEQKPVVASAKYSLNYSRHCWSTIIWTITVNGCSQYIHQIWNERKLGTRTQTSSSKPADGNINWKKQKKSKCWVFIRYLLVAVERVTWRQTMKIRMNCTITWTIIQYTVQYTVQFCG